MKRSLTCAAAAALLAQLGAAGTAGATPPGTAMTYQGRLMQSGQPYNGNASMRFSLYDAATGGNLVGGPIVMPVVVSGGLFTASVDFGAGVLTPLGQSALWLEIGVGTATGPLSPRQAVTAAPLALHATRAAGATDLFDITGANGSLNFATGRIGIDPAISGIIIHVRDVSIDDPTSTQPKMLHFGTAAGSPSIGYDPNVSGMSLNFGTAAGSPYMWPVNWIMPPPIPEGGLLLGATEVQVGGPNAPMPTLRLGGLTDPDIRYDRSAGSIILNKAIIAIGDGSVSQPRLLRFGDPVGGPAIGTDPSVAGIIIIGGRDLTIGGPGEAGAKTLHFGVNTSIPPPFIGASANDVNLLMLNARNGIRLDGSFVGVGLASTATPQFRLDMPNMSAAGGQGRANAWVTYSSRRWKENIRPIEGALDKVARLEGVSFDWQADQGGGHDIGFVAEDVGRVLPELVEWEPDGIWARSLKYDRLTAVAVEAIKEQQEQIEALRSNIAEQKKLNSAQASQLADLAAHLGRLETSQPK